MSFFLSRPFLKLRHRLATNASMRWALALTMALTCAHCKLRRGDEDSKAKGLSVASEFLWQKNEISVCFKRDKAKVSGDQTKFEQVVGHAIKGAFSADATVITFTGFGDCGSDANADLWIIFDDSFYTATGKYAGSNRVGTLAVSGAVGFAGIDHAALKIASTSIADYLAQLTDKSAKASLDDAMAELVLHEIGHVVGLNHEHIHPKSTCHPNGADLEANAKTADAYIDHGLPYDPYSIMSYCKVYAALGAVTARSSGSDSNLDPAIDFDKLRKGLSSDDTDLIKKLYSGSYGAVAGAGSTTNTSTPAATTAASPASSNEAKGSGAGGKADNSAANSGSASPTTADSSLTSSARAPNGYPYCTKGHDADTVGGSGWGWDVTQIDPKGTNSCVIIGGQADGSAKASANQ